MQPVFTEQGQRPREKHQHKLLFPPPGSSPVWEELGKNSDPQSSGGDYSLVCSLSSFLSEYGDITVQTLWSSHAETAPLCHRQDQKLQR